LEQNASLKVFDPVEKPVKEEEKGEITKNALQLQSVFCQL
jgi:hypothetical protein